MAGRGLSRRPTLGAAVGCFAVVAGLVIGLRPLADNSFFTHLATGRLILATGHVPSTDPYTFTAHGTAWVVQSWLASWLYATAEAFGGAVGLRLLIGLTVAAVVALAWRLTRAAESVVVRLAIGVLFVLVGGELWGERPFMFGLLALACVHLAADDGLDPRLLLPIGWLWTNVHGSFPLGVVLLALLAVGTRLDGGDWATELRSLRWLVGGILLGAIGPVGPRLLTFPAELLERQDVLRNIVEWRAPTFVDMSQRLFVVQLVVAILLLARRPTYRAGLVLAVFTAAALLSARNLTVASLLMLPGMAAAAPSFGSLRCDARTSLARILAPLAVVTGVLVSVGRLSEQDYTFTGYPIRALSYLEQQDIDLTTHRLASRDVVGAILELTYGADGRVFYDDRFDMFPEDVTNAHLAMVQVSERARAGFEDFDIELALWERSSAITQLLTLDPEWRVLMSDDGWVLLCHRGVELGGRAGTC